MELEITNQLIESIAIKVVNLLADEELPIGYIDNVFECAKRIVYSKTIIKKDHFKITDDEMIEKISDIVNESIYSSIHDTFLKD